MYATTSEMEGLHARRDLAAAEADAAQWDAEAKGHAKVMADMNCMHSSSPVRQTPEWQAAMADQQRMFRQCRIFECSAKDRAKNAREALSRHADALAGWDRKTLSAGAADC